MPRPNFSNDLAIIVKACLLFVLAVEAGQLAPKCAKCGGTLLSVLEPNHIEGRDWKPRELSRLKRAIRYCADFKNGVPLNILCRRCNAVDGAIKGNAWWHEFDDCREELPF